MEYLLPLAVSDGTFKHQFAAAVECGQDRLSFSDLKVCSPKDPAQAVKQSVKYALDIPRYTGGGLLAGSAKQLCGSWFAALNDRGFVLSSG